MLESIQKVVNTRMLLFILFALFAVTASTLWASFLKPALQSYRTLEQQSSQMRSVALDPALGEQRVSRLRQDVADLKANVAENGSSMMRGVTALNVMADISQFAEQHTLTLLGVSPGKLSTANDYRETPFDVVVTGSYQSIFSWVHQIEIAEKPIYIKSLSISPGADNASRYARAVVALIQPDAGS